MRIFLFAMYALPLGIGCGGGEDEKPAVDAGADADTHPPPEPMYALQQESPTTVGHLFRHLGPLVHA